MLDRQPDVVQPTSAYPAAGIVSGSSRMRLIRRMEAVAARRRLAPRTLEVYQAWVRQSLRFHRDVAGAWGHPAELPEAGYDIRPARRLLGQTRASNRMMNAE